MKELFALTENHVIGSLIEKVMTDKGVSRFGARLLVLHMLWYMSMCRTLSWKR